MALGAYAVAILGQRGLPFELGLVLGARSSPSPRARSSAFPALKVKHHFLAMVTLGFNIIVFLVLRNWESLTGGSFGISGIARPAGAPISFTSDRAYYLYILGWAAVVVAHRVLDPRPRGGDGPSAPSARTRCGRRRVGVSLRNYKLMAFAIGARVRRDRRGALRAAARLHRPRRIHPRPVDPVPDDGRHGRAGALRGPLHRRDRW